MFKCDFSELCDIIAWQHCRRSYLAPHSAVNTALSPRDLSIIAFLRMSFKEALHGGPDLHHFTIHCATIMR